MSKLPSGVPPEKRNGRFPDPREAKDVAELGTLVTHLGLLMIASVGIGLGMGHLLDRWTGHGFWKAVFIPLGVASGFWAVYKAIRHSLHRSEKRWTSDRK